MKRMNLIIRVKEWWKNGVRHREDGPALLHIPYIGDNSVIEYYNLEEWYKEGKCHREDGPAVTWYGKKSYYYNDKEIKCKSTEEFIRLIKLKMFW